MSFHHANPNAEYLSFPDAFTRTDGTRIENVEQWTARQTEIWQLFAAQMYGAFPPGVDFAALRVEMREGCENALGGKARRQQVTLHFAGNGHELAVDVLIYLPAAANGPVPAFLGLNFFGNHTVHADPEILLPSSWVPNSEVCGAVENRASEIGRGVQSSRWQVERVLEAGYALVTVYCGDIDPDFDDGFANGVQPLFYRPGQTRPDADEWGTIGAWAWGLSRVLDYLENENAIDATRVAVIGHSRLGKAALWAGASDERFALVVSNNSGCGGAAISRTPLSLGQPAARETLAIMNSRFPHWFCDNFRQYDHNETALPFDQHMLLALIAPRPLYVASASEDLWAYPEGEFFAAVRATPAYELFGKPGMPTENMPPLDHPVVGSIGYHIRTGKHDICAYDWEQYLKFADLHLKPG